MKRIGILTAGGDTPALNATIHGAVVRANQRGRNLRADQGLQQPVQPAGATRPSESAVSGDPGARSDQGRHTHRLVARLRRPGSTGGDRPDHVASEEAGDRGSDLHRRRRHAQRLAAAVRTPAHRARPEDDRQRPRVELSERAGRMGPRRGPDAGHALRYERPSRTSFDLEQMVNYVTPGYATAVFVSAQGVERIRTTAESHRRIAIIEVMGRHSGYIALGHGLRPAGHHPRPRASARSRPARRARRERSTTCRRTW